MRWEHLIPACCELITTYNPVLYSPDTHFQQVYGKHDDRNEAQFLQQVFYGCNRYKAFLNELIKAIFRVQPTTTNHNDVLPFSVVAYLALFRLEELGIKNFKKLIDTQEVLKMHTLLSFIFSPETLRSNVRAEWCQLYDYKFIDTEIIGKVEEHLQDMTELLSKLSVSASGPRTEETKSETKQVRERKETVPKPFNLTKPKPRRLLRPIEIPKVKAAPVDQRIYNQTLSDVETAKAAKLLETTSKTKAKYDFDHDPIKRLFAS